MRKGFYLFFLVLLFAACKKDKDQSGRPPVVKTDWNAELKKSVWNVEIQYTNGSLLVPQYGSFIFGNDNTLRMADMWYSHDFTWSVTDSTITMDESGIKRKADVGKTAWKYFENSLAFQYNILSVTKSVALDPVALVGTVWKGTFAGGNLQLEFLPANSTGNQLKITHPKVNGGLPYTSYYSTYGSGVLFSSPYLGVPINIRYFGCLYNNEFRGLAWQSTWLQLYWKATKQ